MKKISSSKIQMTEAIYNRIQRLASISLNPTRHWDKRFVTNMAKKTLESKITKEQAKWVNNLFLHYRAMLNLTQDEINQTLRDMGKL
jgi:hypothetical protein